MVSITEKVKATLKSQDTEGWFEIHFTRTPGYLWALFFKHLHIHPIAVTLMSIVIGAASGWCCYFDDLGHTLLGIFLLLWANWFDCADGQLARMTGKSTLIGRILDGFAGDVWFFCIYFGICMRLTPTWGWWIWLLAAWAGCWCHSRQCAVADYYRNIHLFFQLGRDRSELDRAARLTDQYNALRWRSAEWFNKLYLFFYIRYTSSQERQTPQFQQLYTKIQETWDGNIPASFREAFRQKSRPLMPMTNILTFDTRVGVLFASLLVGIPWLYFVAEATVFEGLRYRMVRTHEAFCQQFLNDLPHYQ